MRFSPQISISTRVSISLVLLSITTLTFARLSLGDRDFDKQQLAHRTSLCESLAISCSLLAERGDTQAIQYNLDAIVKRNAEIASARLKREDGMAVAEAGTHDRNWTRNGSMLSDINNIQVPISNHGARWGMLEIAFTRRSAHPVIDFLMKPSMMMLGVTLALNAILFRWYLGRILTYLNPASAVPQHVRSTIDTFAEGVAVLDPSRRIVLANAAFAKHIEAEPAEAMGRSMDEFNWSFDGGASAPWSNVRNAECSGQTVKLSMPGKGERTFLVSASPILDDHGKPRGTIVSFDDITDMEQKRLELGMMLSELQISRDELTKRNRELQILATRDPLTGCLNRRTFFETFDQYWNSALRGKLPLSCAMVDIDFFKSINDNHGHQMGDEVLKAVAKTLQDAAGTDYLPCRYGGEEFCFLMPHVGIDQAEEICERIRVAISELKIGPVRITTSVGISALSLSPADPQELLDQADKCLYVAKRNGRNQVVRWDDVPEDLEVDESAVSRTNEDDAIPYPAVASLVSALAYRHPDTAAHSTRVAEYAVAVARGLMSAKDAYVLEIAALLHDIGKIGVPDAILLKPGPLTPEEWKVMRIHDRIGIEIIESSFANKSLIRIMRHHHTPYQSKNPSPNVPSGEELPLGARLVAIADAYDAIVSDRVYRKGRSRDEAFAELRRCAGAQFDPELVERFISVVQDHQTLHLSVASKYSAQQIGMQIERLADALDTEDRDTIVALATRLEAMAAHCQIAPIQDLAGEIKAAANNGDDIQPMVDLTEQLIDLCRSTQHSYVEVGEAPQVDRALDTAAPSLGDQPVQS